LIDTNVLLDVLGDDPKWGEWSSRQLKIHRSDGGLRIDAVVYAEASVAYDRIEEMDARLSDMGIVLAPTPRRALFLAGKAYRQYKLRGGRRLSVLPDFFIGAHALVANLPLITRDVRRIRTYFPTVELIAPSN
jgi:predicted nucleic acid-binding protein